jgi:hypothetical protein
MEQEAERRRKVEEDAKAAANKNDVIIDDSEIMENTNRYNRVCTQTMHDALHARM